MFHSIDTCILKLVFVGDKRIHTAEHNLDALKQLVSYCYGLERRLLKNLPSCSEPKVNYYVTSEADRVVI